MARAFVDTNVLIYLMSADAARADRAEAVIGADAVSSVQVFNEMANVARRKLGMGWQELDEFLGLVRALCPPEPLTLATHDRGRQIAERYQLSVYDAMIVASALLAGCDVLYSEDMQHGLVIEGQTRICNPFSETS
ncbi:MAG: PIN domain-containing protein [Pseudomonadota bacterium]